jgi:hypothetical protein
LTDIQSANSESTGKKRRTTDYRISAKAGFNFAGTSGGNLAFDRSQLIATESLRSVKRVNVILPHSEQVKQVEMETKFIEVQHSELHELQFGWNSTSKHPGPDVFCMRFWAMIYQ